MLYQQESSRGTVCFATLIIGNRYHVVPVIISHYWLLGKRLHHVGRLSFVFSFNFHDKFIALSKCAMSYKVIASIKMSASQGDIKGLPFQRLLSPVWPWVSLGYLKMLLSVFSVRSVPFVSVLHGPPPVRPVWFHLPSPFFGHNRGWHWFAYRYTDISFSVPLSLPLTALLLPLSVLTLATQRSITMVMGANWMAEV